MSNYRFYAENYAKRMAVVFCENALYQNRIQSVILAPRFLAYLVTLSQSVYLDKAIKLGEQIAMRCQVQSVIAHRQRGNVIYQIQLPKRAWQTVRKSDLQDLGVGLGIAKSQVNFSFDDAPHTLVSGSTGSGKSEAVKTVLLTLLSYYDPGQLKVVIVDPHNDYSDFEYASHLACPIARSQEDITKAFQYVNQVFAHRKRENIRDDYRLLLVVDEAQNVFLDETNLKIAQSLASQSRKFKVNLIISTGKPDEKSMPKIIPSLDNKFVGKVTNSRLSASVSGHAGLQLHKLLGEGDMCHISPNKIERFQVALTSKTDFNRLPRGEVKQPEIIETFDSVPDIEIPEQKTVGRNKELEILPLPLVYYLSDNGLTMLQAEVAFSEYLTNHFGKDRKWGRNWHDLHKDFAQKMLTEMSKHNLKLLRG